MSEQILQSIYNLTKNYKDPLSNKPLDQNNTNFQVVIKNGNVNISLSINSDKAEDANKLSDILKKGIEKIIPATGQNPLHVNFL